MSGGHFDYDQYRIRNIIESIESELNNQGKLKERLFYNPEYYEKFPEDKYYTIYPEEIQEKFREAIEILKKAEIYAQRVDYYLSGDDGEDSFLERLEDDLNRLQNKG
jgi:hypothetical protein